VIKTALRISTLDQVQQAAEWGAAAVEPRPGDLATDDAVPWVNALARHGLAACCINTVRLVREQGLTLVHPEARVRDQAMDKLKGMIDIGRALDCPLNIGLFRGAALEGKPVAYSKDLLVEILRQACGYAQEAGVVLLLEPTNRFDLNFIQTTDEGLAITERVDHPNLGILLDVYPMYIEDPTIAASIARAAGLVRYIYLKDSDGSKSSVRGELDFRAILAALKSIDYQGYVSIGLDPDGDDRARRSIVWLNELIETG
jgi:sugar phosphate isomerase/epimerase